MPRYEYDEEASQREGYDVVSEVGDDPVPSSVWVEAMRRINAINEPLARRLVALHRDCGSGTGECDSGDDGVSIRDSKGWGCETMGLIASHFGVNYPSAGRQI